MPKRRPVGNSDLAKVWRSYLGGSRTTVDVSLHLGLSVKRCSAYTYELRQRGLLIKTGPAPKVEGKPGIRPFWYEPVEVRKHA